jgi:hypothetical protein
MFTCLDFFDKSDQRLFRLKSFLNRFHTIIIHRYTEIINDKRKIIDIVVILGYTKINLDIL